MNARTKISCTVEVLTRNSAATLARCLESVKDFAEIIILDGNSTDGTLEIANQYGCRIVKQYDTNEPLRRITDFSEVRNKGMRLAKYDWFLYVDSDEYLSPEAGEEIRSIVENPKPKAYVFWQPRVYVFDGKAVNCATTYPNQQPRFFHRGAVEGFIKPVHERVAAKAGVKVGKLQKAVYVPLAMSDFEKLERYTDMEEALYADARLPKRLKLAVRQAVLLGLFAVRYLRNLIFCRGVRLPLRYEMRRHWRTTCRTLGLILRLIKIQTNK